MDPVYPNSLHTPCVHTNDLLQDTNDFPQDNKNTYYDLISYPSVPDDLWALSHTLLENPKAARVWESAFRSSDTDG